MKPDHLSPSQIALFEMCGLAYKYVYVDKLPKPPPTVQMVKGSLIHYMLEKRIMQDKELNLNWAIDNFKLIPNSPLSVMSEQDVESVVKAAQKAIPVIEEMEWYPEEPVELCEQELIYTIDGIKMIVKPDIVTENSVYDHKVIGINSLFRYERLTYPDQLVIGAMATNKSYAYFNLFIEDKKGDFIFRRIKYDYIKLRYKRVVEKIRKVWNMIQNDMFYPVDKDGDNKWKCSAKFCDFYGTCEFGAKDALPGEESSIPF